MRRNPMPDVAPPPRCQGHEARFRLNDIDFACDEIPVKHKAATFGAINNGVDSMTIILRFIYREYCRTCLMHCRYL